MFDILPIEISQEIFQIAERQWLVNEQSIVGSGKVNARCNHTFLRGPRKGKQCGVRCRVNEGGKCAQHGSGPMFMRRRMSNIVRYKKPPKCRQICKSLNCK